MEKMLRPKVHWGSVFNPFAKPKKSGASISNKALHLSNLTYTLTSSNNWHPSYIQTMALPHGTPPKHVLRPICKSAQPLEKGRRSMLSFLLLSSMPPTMMSEANDSKKALLEEYLRRSKENKEKNDKERLDDYYRRNYKDYFELIEGTVKDKKEELLSESEKEIREWLKKNK